jgi:hypothetical protein
MVSLDVMDNSIEGVHRNLTVQTKPCQGVRRNATDGFRKTILLMPAALVNRGNVEHIANNAVIG